MGTIQFFLSMFTKLYNHHHNAFRTFHHPQKKAYILSCSLPSAHSNHQSMCVSMDLPALDSWHWLTGYVAFYDSILLSAQYFRVCLCCDIYQTFIPLDYRTTFLCVDNSIWFLLSFTKGQTIY